MSVTRLGVSLLKVVATIDRPASHQGTARPDAKNSDVLWPARLPKNNAGTKQTRSARTTMIQSRTVSDKTVTLSRGMTAGMEIRPRRRQARQILGVLRLIPACVTHSLRLALAATALMMAGSSTALAQSPPAHKPEPVRPAEPTTFPNLSLFDNRLTTGTKPKSLLDSWLSGVEMNCIGCRGFETTGVRPRSSSLTVAVEKTLLKRASGATVGVTADLLFPFATDPVASGDPRMTALTSPAVRFGIVFRW